MHSCMSFFVTLTYDTEHIMFCPKNRPTLYPSHLTAYWKLLRAKLNHTKFKYYACGEYGSNKKRPHYHIILFIKNTDLSPTKLLNELEKLWQHGTIYVGTVTAESVAYTLKYISKKGSVPQYNGDTRVPEFQRVSKGLGIDYLKTIGQWHIADLINRAYVPLPGGNKAPMPRYYKDKIFTKEQKEIIGKHMEEKIKSREVQSLIELRIKSSKKVNNI